MITGAGHGVQGSLGSSCSLSPSYSQPSNTDGSDDSWEGEELLLRH